MNYAKAIVKELRAQFGPLRGRLLVQQDQRQDPGRRTGQGPHHAGHRRPRHGSRATSACVCTAKAISAQSQRRKWWRRFWRRSGNEGRDQAGARSIAPRVAGELREAIFRALRALRRDSRGAMLRAPLRRQLQLSRLRIAKSRAAEWPIFGRPAEICFHGIVFNVTNRLQSLSRVAHVAIPIVRLPETTRSDQAAYSPQRLQGISSSAQSASTGSDRLGRAHGRDLASLPTPEVQTAGRDGNESPFPPATRRGVHAENIRQGHDPDIPPVLSVVLAKRCSALRSW